MFNNLYPQFSACCLAERNRKPDTVRSLSFRDNQTRNHPSTTHNWSRVTLSLLALCLVFSTSVRAQDAGNTDAVLVKSIEATLAPHFKADDPGATVIVTRGGKTLYRGAFGLAEMEKKTPLKPDDVLRIGSVTKQFTAVAILILADQGKLNLSDLITKHLSDYPKTGDAVNIEHLITHTSGYFLLGAIIECVSGMSYADFVAKNIFNRGADGKVNQLVLMQGGRETPAKKALKLQSLSEARSIDMRISKYWQPALEQRRFLVLITMVPKAQGFPILFRKRFTA